MPEELTEETIKARSEQQRLKVKTHRLRNLRRRMVKIQRGLQHGTIQKVPQHERADFLQFETGELDQKLDELTIQHGYGKLRARQGHLGPKGFAGADRVLIG